jgi:hypothetical protein
VVEEGQLVNYNKAADRRDQAAAQNAREPDHDEAMMDPGPENLEAMIATISPSDNNWVVFDTPPWRYYAEKYNAEREIEPAQCQVGQDLVKYLANRERDCQRSQSNPLCKRKNLIWCRQREDLDQQYIHNVLRTGLSKEGGRGRSSLHGQSGRWN